MSQKVKAHLWATVVTGGFMGVLASVVYFPDYTPFVATVVIAATMYTLIFAVMSVD